MWPFVPETVLVADHGVSAVRTLQGLQRLGIKAVSVHTAEDSEALHATVADETVLLGETRASYRDPVKLVEAAQQAGAQAVHPAHADLPGLEAAVREAGLEWLGGPLRLPVELTIGDGVVEARLAEADVNVPPIAARAAEVVSGIDLTSAALEGAATGIVRGGVALSVDIVASEPAEITAWQAPELDDVWLDSAVETGSTPVDRVLGVLTAWGPDRDAAYALACAAWDLLVVEGPVVLRPEALGGTA
ncbi:MAG: acetyl/propionyl-CoA carboxylase subunit alpha [Frankiales bacterium]|nr:acetyl/propionyl-CoA carboxylase subunit alpha [Frankiales bacterium]